MNKESICEQLLRVVGTIKTFDGDNYQRKILESVAGVFDFFGYMILDVVNYNSIKFSEIDGLGHEINQDDFLEFMENELYAWAIEQGPYVGKFDGVTVVAISFIQQTWGVFLSRNSVTPDYLDALDLFTQASDSWFRTPEMFEVSTSLVKYDLESERKFMMLSHLYSVSEWEWDFKTGKFNFSDSFLALFDQSYEEYGCEMADFQALIGNDNIDRFNECVTRIVKDKYQVLEEFKCPLIDGRTFQNIQMLMDPLDEDGEFLGIKAYCRDNGRTFQSNSNSLKWYDSEWMNNLTILPLEWIHHFKGDCEITLSPFHRAKMTEDMDQLVIELEKYLCELNQKQSIGSQLNVSIQFPFSKYKYQLLAARSEQDSLLWRGFVILLEECDSSADNQSALVTFDAYNQRCIFNFIKCLSSIPSLENYHRLMQYIVSLSRHSVDEYAFDDFWNQLNEVCRASHSEVLLQHKMDSSYRVLYAQWILSLVAFVINYFHLQHQSVTIHCTEPPIVESQNIQIVNANHVMAITITTSKLSAASEMLQLFFQLGLLGSGVDLNFLSNDFEWKCTIYSEVKVFEQPQLIDTHIIHEKQDAPKKKTLLIVDDDIYNTQTLEVLFHGDGFRTVTANQGEQALRILNSMDDIHAIILDLRMPVMDGFELLSLMTSPEYKETIGDIPVVILSANITPDVIARLREYNVSCIMEKPFDLEELILKVNRVIVCD